MERRAGWDKRRLIVPLLLCLMVLGQSAALLEAPEPHHATEHCCLLCHVGALPFLDTASVATVAPIVVLERLISDPSFEAATDVLPAANSSRAPPV